MNLDLNTSISLYREVIESLPYSTGIFDNQVRYVYINKVAESLCGTPMAEVVGKTPYDILPKDMCDNFVPLIHECIENKETIIERVVFNFSDDEIILNLSYIPVFSDDGEVEFVIALTEDWTELENERSDAIANARLASLGHMAANITHEINNPMQLIQLRLFRLEEMIEDEPDNKDKMLAEIKDIFRTTNRVSKIVESVRRQAKRNTHESISTVKIRDIIEEAITYSKNLIDYAKAELILELKKDFSLNCNSIEIEQVLINLISNSCDAITKLDTRWVKITAFEEGDYVVIQVSDSGFGIDEEAQKNLMKPFFTTKKFNKGTGLGLNLSKTLVKRNDGDLSYLPEKKNTTFEIRQKKP